MANGKSVVCRRAVVYRQGVRRCVAGRSRARRHGQLDLSRGARRRPRSQRGIGTGSSSVSVNTSCCAARSSRFGRSCGSSNSCHGGLLVSGCGGAGAGRRFLSLIVCAPYWTSDSPIVPLGPLGWQGPGFRDCCRRLEAGQSRVAPGPLPVPPDGSRRAAVDATEWVRGEDRERHDLQDRGRGGSQGDRRCGVLALIVGLLLATVLFLRGLRGGDSEAAYKPYRQRIGRSILLSLEFLVAADIIRTVALEPTFRGVGVLAIVVLVRTFLSFTLEVEVEGRWPWSRTRTAASARVPG
jgi:uncharacterized membrane protein